VTDDAALAAASTATFATAARVVAIVRPRGVEEVRACLRAASSHGVALHPVSRGKNWGYGSRVPPRDGCALLDLSRMRRILAFDERLGYVTLEPGVTFRRLHRFLRARGSRLHANPPGTTPDASPLANALERGLGQGPIGDRFLGLCGLEVALATGAVVRTGFARWRGAATGPLHRFGVGPALDGLFSQSNLGVVTRGTLWLSPIPRWADGFEGTLAGSKDLVRAVDALRPLFLAGALRSPVKLVNRARWLSSRMRYPWDLAGGRAPLPPRVARALFDRPFAWRLTGFLEHATPAHRSPQRRMLSRALRGACGPLRFATESWLRRASARGWEEAHRPTLGFDVAATYWRKREPAPRRLDPDRDGCGAIWCSPVVPLVGRDVARAVRIVERTARDAGFDAMATVTVLDGRTAHVVAPILFDRAVRGEDARALACAERMLRRLARAGYYPYRLGLNAAGLLPQASDDGDAVRRALKAALDPNDVLSPGRYGG
jgi:4-cresol dehydrogenase (hydroxylating)